MQNKLILMKGISCSSKSTIAIELKEKYNATILSSDDIREELGIDYKTNDVFKIIEDRASVLLLNGSSVIIDATNLTMKKHRRYKELARKCNVPLYCHYVITHSDIWETYAKNRIETKWTHLNMNDMYDIRQNMYLALSSPMKSEFDKIIYHITDIEIEEAFIKEFKDYYNNNLDLFLNNTKEFMAPLYENGLLKKVIPEIYNMYGFDQMNTYHELTLENHTFKVCDELETKTEENIWSGLLHDVGKLTNGIRRKKETGYYSYVGHAGASSELAMCILHRLGFELKFCENVSIIVNKHMYLPYQGTLKSSKVKELGDTLFKTLKEFRAADKNAHTDS